MIPAARRKSLVFPREHGAWGILLVPLVTGAAAGLLAGGNALPLAPLTIAVLALFWLRTPVESWIGAAPVRARTAGEFQVVRKAVVVLAATALAALVWLFWGGGNLWHNLALVWIGAAAGTAFLAQALVKQAGRDSRAAAQIIGAAGLTAVAPAAYYAVTDAFTGAAWALWIANLLLAANQIQFVQLRIRAARAMEFQEKLAIGRGFVIAQIFLIALLASACARGYFPWFAALAFAPILFRGFAWFVARPAPLAIRALGLRELLYAGLFGVLLIAGLAVA